MIDRSDREWISVLKQNDPGAHHDLQYLLATWGATLAYQYRVAAYVLEDPIAEAYTRIVLRGIYQFRFQCSFFGYCRRILVNEINRYMKKLGPSELPEPPDLPVQDASDKIILEAQLSNCLNRLTGQERTVITSLYFKGLSPEQVAELLGITRIYVNVIASRARKKLRECMQE